MSFSSEAKKDLARHDCDNISEKRAELSAIVSTSSSINIAGYKKINLKIITELNSVARKIYKILKDDYNINTSIIVNKNQMLKRTNSYVLEIDNDMGAISLMIKLNILKDENSFMPLREISDSVVCGDAEKRAYLRGAFLGCGSVSNPEKNYHLEFVVNNSTYANSLMNLINSLGFTSKVVERKNNFIVYIKESEQISDLLGYIGASSAMFSLQNIKIIKEMRNNVNRLVNCETANLSKTVDAAVRQIEDINIIQKNIGINKLPQNLQQLIKLRLEFEDVSLKELGEMLKPPIGKSGVNHRFKKIEKIADKYR